MSSLKGRRKGGRRKIKKKIIVHGKIFAAFMMILLKTGNNRKYAVFQE
jgi:hypothetical protein